MLKHIHRVACEATERLENQLQLLRGCYGYEHEELVRELEDAFLEIRSVLEADGELTSMRQMAASGCSPAAG